MELFWHDYNGIKVSYGTIAAYQTKNMNTYATHPWSADGEGRITVDNAKIFVPEAADNGRTILIDDDQPDNSSGFFQFHNASDQEIELYSILIGTV